MQLEYEANWLKGYLRAISSMKSLVIDFKLQINDQESQAGIERILKEIDLLKRSAEKHEQAILTHEALVSSSDPQRAHEI